MDHFTTVHNTRMAMTRSMSRKARASTRPAARACPSQRMNEPEPGQERHFSINAFERGLENWRETAAREAPRLPRVALL